MSIYLSNRLEVLFSHLKENLFPRQSSFFSKRLLVVPSSALEFWVRKQIASDPDLQIASGLQSFFLNQAVFHLRHLLFETDEKINLPSNLEITFRIENAIHEVLELKDDPQWLQLIEYIGTKKERIFPLSVSLSSLFHRYNIYGMPLHELWEKSPKDWQEALWARIFSKDKTCERFFLDLKRKKTLPKELSLHLFSFSHLSALHFNFFQQVSTLIPTNFYQLSPCLEFWSDTKSQGEVQRFFKRHPLKKGLEIAIEAYREENNPLLADMGLVGRKMAFLIEESEFPLIECYEEPEDNRALHSIQKGILLNTPLHFKEDESIQIHAFSTLHREIEGLYQLLLELMGKEDIEPCDVIVAAPDIGQYIPYIHAIFGQGVIDYQITDMPLSAEKSSLRGLFLLLTLNEKKWSVENILELITHPLFLKKKGWKQNDIALLKKWIDEGGIRGGFEGKRGTWIEGIDRLFFLYAKTFDATLGLEYSDAPLLGDLNLLLIELRDDLQPIEAKHQKTLSDWCLYLETLREKYFGASEEPFFEELQKNSSLFPGRSYEFLEIMPLLKRLFSEEKITFRGNHLQTVRFCSMLPMRALPAKVICLIGMNHDAFPRQEKFISLDLLKKEGKGDFCPSRSDFDRYLFLEAILSARKFLVMSYLGRSSLDQTELPPSSLVLNLGVKNIVHHPDFAFDPFYFNESSPFKHALNHDYKAAQANIQDKTSIGPFLHFLAPLKTPFIGEINVELAQLTRLSAYPLKDYFQRCLKIYFPQERTREEEEFLLSSLQFASLKKETFQKPLTEVIESAKVKGNFPLGSFANLGSFRLHKETLSFKGDNIFSIELVPYLKEMECDEKGNWKVPSLVIPFENGKVTLSGKIEAMTDKGLLVLDKNEWKGVVKSWPQFLTLNCLVDSHFSFASNLLLGKDRKVKDRFFDDPMSHLRAFIEHYLACVESPSPLFAEWIEPLIQGDEVLLKRAISKLVETRHYEKEVIFAFRNREYPSSKQLLSDWQEPAQTLYGGLLDAWF